MYVLSGKTLEIKWLDSRFYFIIIINEEPFYIKLILKYANVVIEDNIEVYVCKYLLTRVSHSNLRTKSTYIAS